MENTTRFTRAMSIALLCAVTAPTTGQVVADPAFRTQIEKERQEANELLKRIPGLSVAVALDGQLVWAEGFGYTDIVSETPVSPNTIFRIYSLSKSITAITMMRLAQTDRIDIDVPISTIVENLDGDIGKATPRQLAGHLGGIRHYGDDEAWNQRHCRTPQDAVEIFSHDGSVQEPGSAYLYSSWGYALLSRVLEAAAAEPFASLVATQVLEPAGMTSTSLGEPMDPSRATRFYDRRGFIFKRNRPAEEVDISCKWGGGAFLATASDVALMGGALLTGNLLDPAALDILMTAMETNDGESTGYAMGLGVNNRTEQTLLTHTGSGVGGRSVLLLAPESKLAVVVLANNRDEKVVDFGVGLLRSFLDQIEVVRN